MKLIKESHFIIDFVEISASNSDLEDNSYITVVLQYSQLVIY